MSIQLGTTFQDDERRQDAVRNRLWRARESLGLTQQEFAAQISITRDRVASYEDGRALLRCDIALRACRHFFISEFWLAFGAVSEEELKATQRVEFSDLRARLTMALAIEPIALSIRPGASFIEAFDSYLRQAYIRLAVEMKGFPRIKPLGTDAPEYYSNALHCAVEFWRAGLSPEQWQSFFYLLVVGGQSMHRQVQTDPTMVLKSTSIIAGDFAPLPFPSAEGTKKRDGGKGV
jgi:DNA-binding XRE family transcriptional regulator